MFSVSYARLPCIAINPEEGKLWDKKTPMVFIARDGISLNIMFSCKLNLHHISREMSNKTGKDDGVAE